MVIISTVRTPCHSTWSDLEQRKDLGFFTNPKLLNTAFTRARSQVVFVGEPVALASIGDCKACWKTIFWRCQQHDLFKYRLSLARVLQIVTETKMKANLATQKQITGTRRKRLSGTSPGKETNSIKSDDKCPTNSPESPSLAVPSHLGKYRDIDDGLVERQPTNHPASSQDLCEETESEIATAASNTRWGLPVIKDQHTPEKDIACDFDFHLGSRSGSNPLGANSYATPSSNLPCKTNLDASNDVVDLSTSSQTLSNPLEIPTYSQAVTQTQSTPADYIDGACDTLHQRTPPPSYQTFNFPNNPVSSIDIPAKSQSTSLRGPLHTVAEHQGEKLPPPPGPGALGSPPSYADATTSSVQHTETNGLVDIPSSNIQEMGSSPISSLQNSIGETTPLNASNSSLVTNQQPSPIRPIHMAQQDLSRQMFLVPNQAEFNRNSFQQPSFPPYFYPMNPFQIPMFSPSMMHPGCYSPYQSYQMPSLAVPNEWNSMPFAMQTGHNPIRLHNPFYDQYINYNQYSQAMPGHQSLGTANQFLSNSTFNHPCFSVTGTQSTSMFPGAFNLDNLRIQNLFIGEYCMFMLDQFPELLSIKESITNDLKKAVLQIEILCCNYDKYERTYLEMKMKEIEIKQWLIYKSIDCTILRHNLIDDIQEVCGDELLSVEKHLEELKLFLEHYRWKILHDKTQTAIRNEKDIYALEHHVQLSMYQLEECKAMKHSHGPKRSLCLKKLEFIKQQLNVMQANREEFENAMQPVIIEARKGSSNTGEVITTHDSELFDSLCANLVPENELDDTKESLLESDMVRDFDGVKLSDDTDCRQWYEQRECDPYVQEYVTCRMRQTAPRLPASTPEDQRGNCAPSESQPTSSNLRRNISPNNTS